MERQEDKRLKELQDKNVPIYSISRLDAINHCLYGAYRTYILNERGPGNVYSVLGGAVHDVLEGITEGTATEKDLRAAVDQELENIEMLGLEFPNEQIKNNWVKDMLHFCETYKHPNGNMLAEQLFIYKTSKGHYLQGYIDLTHVLNDKEISIYDYKTSTMYKGEEIKEHGRQLVTYLLGKEQEGLSVRKVAWMMTKYCTVKFLGKKTAKSKEETLIEKTLERRKLADEMKKYVEADLQKLGYDEIDAEIMLNDFVEKNSFNVLPDPIKEKYKISPCVVFYDVTPEVKQECEDYINNTIEMWESLDPSKVENYPPKSFTKTQKNGKVVEDTFFCVNLCDHFKKCPYIHDFLDQKVAKEEDPDDDLF